MRGCYGETIFSNLTVRDGSTKIFRRNGNLRAQIFPEHDSEPQDTHLSSVKDVTATRAVQMLPLLLSIFFRNPIKDPISKIQEPKIQRAGIKNWKLATGY